MKKNIVLTGGGGFIGATLIRKSIKKYNVHVIAREGGSLWRLDDLQKDLTIHTGLLEDLPKLTRLMQEIQPKAIFHLATYGAYPSQNIPLKMIDVNVKGTMNLLESIKNVEYDQCIVTGSSSEYGKKDKEMRENDFIEPNNYYAATKAAQTHLCQVFSKTNKKPLLIFRLFNVYGPFEEKGRLVRTVIESVLNKKPIPLATGKEARDFIHVEDVADAFLRGIHKRTLYGEVFNIGTGKQTTIKQLAEHIIDITGIKVPIQLNVYPGREWDAFHWKADTKKTENVLGWKAKYSLDEGLKKTIAWYRLQK